METLDSVCGVRIGTLDSVCVCGVRIGNTGQWIWSQNWYTGQCEWSKNWVTGQWILGKNWVHWTVDME